MVKALHYHPGTSAADGDACGLLFNLARYAAGFVKFKGLSQERSYQQKVHVSSLALPGRRSGLIGSPRLPS